MRTRMPLASSGLEVGREDAKPQSTREHRGGEIQMPCREARSPKPEQLRDVQYKKVFNIALRAYAPSLRLSAQMSLDFARDNIQ